MSEHNHGSGEESPSAVSTKTMEIIVAVIVLVLGAMVIYDSLRIGAGWGDEGPKAGFFPFYIGLILCVASFINLIAALRMPLESFVSRAQAKDVLTVLIPIFIYAGAVQVLGIYVASVLYIASFMHFIGKYSWLKSAVVSLGVSVSFFVLFEMWFKVPLIKGPLENLLGLN
jgi:putative tricarboxylic transport membrane protein